MKKLPLALLAAFVMSGCNLFDYHPYDARVSYSDLNRDNIARLEEACAGKETIRFVWMGDTHRWVDETHDMVASINARGDVDFVLHGGDITYFGAEEEFLWIHREMRKLNAPYVAMIGNHDILGNGLYIYKKMYGPLNFSFTAGCTKFICLNTNALEFDYSEQVPDFGYMMEQSAAAGNGDHDRTVVAMHCGPFNEQFNNSSAYIFQRLIYEFKDPAFCLHAHGHHLAEHDYFDDGITYYQCPSVEKRFYMVFTVTPDSYSYETVDY